MGAVFSGCLRGSGELHVEYAGVRRDQAADRSAGERTARSLLSELLADGLLVSDTPYGQVRIGLPLDALGMLFPNLHPEAELRLDEVLFLPSSPKQLISCI